MRPQFSLRQFDNGLTVILEFIPQAVSTAVGFMVRTGARDEDKKYDGVSHFLEHMMFKGTHKRGWLEINRDFDQMGARYNAFTSWEETCYYAWVLNEETPKALDLLTDMLHSRLPDDEFTTEKKVILEEIARYRDMPEHVAFEEAMKLAFAGHRLSSNILGTPQTIGRLTRAEMKAYFDARYVPNNITLFACGNVDEARFMAQVEELWGARNGPRADRFSPPPGFHKGKKKVQKKGVARQNIVMLWPMLPLNDTRAAAASMLGAILGDDRNSRLYWALRHTGLAEDAGGGYWGFTDTGLMAVNAACDPDKATKVADILRNETKKLKDGIKENELQRVKNRARTTLVFSAETPFNRFRQLMQQWMVRRELLTTEDMLARLNAVTRNDMYALLEEFPIGGEGVMVGLGPN
ncbi:MAG TPA: pitrilysin family protein [Planctomycetota bacterium]|nr:pitrilysin family protein [Planctomycetota bacterium]